MQNEADYEQNAFAADSIKKAVGIMEAERIKEAAGGVKEADGGTEPEAADEYIPTVPKFISSEEKELVSNERGTAYHRVMNKRAAFREAFDGFDVEKVCAYNEEKLEALRI